MANKKEIDDSWAIPSQWKQEGYKLNPKDPWAAPIPITAHMQSKDVSSKQSKIQCKSCRAIKGNPGLKERYYQAWFNRQPGGESLDMIAKELGMTTTAIYKHAHNHMKRRKESVPVTAQVMQASAQLKAQSMKDLELSFNHENVVPKEDYEQAVDDVITDGMAQLKVKGKEITVNQILAAAKLKGEWKLKKRGQDTELIKMMYRSASGLTVKPTDLGTAGSG